MFFRKCCKEWRLCSPGLRGPAWLPLARCGPYQEPVCRPEGLEGKGEGFLEQPLHRWESWTWVLTAPRAACVGREFSWIWTGPRDQCAGEGGGAVRLWGCPGPQLCQLAEPPPRWCCPCSWAPAPRRSRSRVAEPPSGTRDGLHVRAAPHRLCSLGLGVLSTDGRSLTHHQEEGTSHGPRAFL